MDQLLGCLFAIGLPVIIGLVTPKSNLRRVLLVSSILIFCVIYLNWRLSTFPWITDEGITLSWVWWVLVLLVELAVIIEVLLFLATVTWLSDRRAQARTAEARLRERCQHNGDAAIPSVDVFITTYNEGREVLEKTILGACEIDYPKLTVYVLDDGKRAWLRDFCEQASVQYITRPDNKGAKAGNINHALTRSCSDLVMIMDADFVPYRNCAWITAGLFEDPSLGTVQTPQNFYNPDALQHNLGIARSWSDEQSFFFRLIARGRDSLGVAFCCGSCSIHRRTALEQTGGFPTDSITEDILLTIRFCQLGWKTIYLAEPISTGLAPETLSPYFIQRKRWARGGIQVAWLMIAMKGLKWKEKLFFFPYSWITQYTSRLFFQLVPLVFFATGLAPLPDAEMAVLIQYQVPFLLALTVAMTMLGEGYYVPFFSEAISLFSAFELAPEVLASIVKPFGKGFAVTPKGSDSLSQHAKPYRQVIRPAAIMLGMNLVVLWQILVAGTESVSTAPNMLVLYGLLWSAFNTLSLVVCVLLALEKPQPRLEHRIRIDQPCEVITSTGDVAPANLIDLSLTGALIRAGSETMASTISCLRVNGSLRLPVKMSWQRSQQTVAIAFPELDLATKQNLFGWMFNGSFSASSQPLQLGPIQTVRQILYLSMGAQ